MKKFYRIAWSIESTPAHLAGSLVLSFGVMLFINGFIGSMGGIPAFTAFLLVFYVQRGLVLSGDRISHQLAMDSRTEIRFMLLRYVTGYLLIWAVMKLVLVFSRISGWGNIDGMTAREYLDHIYGNTMLERWAYLFAGILMFAFILSLFPLTVVRRNRAWLACLAVDGVLFAGLCAAIGGVSRFFMTKELRGRAVCVLDDLLLCSPPQRWQAACCIAGALLFTAAVLAAVYGIACKSYAPKPGVWAADESRFLVYTEEEREKLRRRNKKNRFLWGAGAGVVLLASVGILGWVFFGKSNARPHYHQVAECLTEDNRLGPMSYGNGVYLPVDAELDYEETGEAAGYLGYKGEECSSRFYELVVANLLYKGPRGEETYLQMCGADFNAYESAEAAEEEDAWKTDEVFLMWDEEWESESRYTKEVTGYSVCDRELVEALEQEYGNVRYRPQDFTDYDAYFTIRGYASLKEALQEEANHGNWVGCILVKENCFYYGNYDNPITGESLKMLMEVVGGY